MLLFFFITVASAAEDNLFKVGYGSQFFGGQNKPHGMSPKPEVNSYSSILVSKTV